MIKKIAIEQLTPGMFVHDFDAAWKDHPVVVGKRLIASEQEVAVIASQGLRAVFIDTERGMDVDDAPTQAEVAAVLEAQLLELGEGQDDATAGFVPDLSRCTFEEEAPRAMEVKHQARRLAEDVLRDARMGKPVTLGPVRDTISRMVESVFHNQDAMLSLGLLKQKDDYTFMHSVNVGVFLIAFARTLEMDFELITGVGVGAILHDVGKMRVPDAILNKPGKLTDEEFGKMKEHAELSRQIMLETSGIPEVAVLVAHQHHERFDGTGYPLGLEGEEIDLFGQMAAIVDVYDAITSDRIYHKGMNPHLALQKMFEWSKHHFNRDLFQQFVKCVGIYPMGTVVRLRNGLLGVVVRSNPESLLHPVVKVAVDTKRMRRLRPVELNLLAHKADPHYQILRSEPAEQWKIEPREFMPTPEIYGTG